MNAKDPFNFFVCPATCPVFTAPTPVSFSMKTVFCPKRRAITPAACCA